jgi:hypothetical protein
MVDDTTIDYWQIRDIDSDTKARIKAYAARNRLTIPQALTRLIDQAESTNGKD